MTTVGEKLFAYGRTNGARRARHQRHFPGQRLIVAARELRVLEAAVLHVEQFRFVEALVRTHRMDLGLGGQRVRRDIANDTGGNSVLPRAQRSQARKQQHARVRVEGLDTRGQPRPLPREVGLIVGRITPDRFRQLGAQFLRVVIVRRLEPKWPGFGADQMVGGQRRRKGQITGARGIHKIQHLAVNERPQNNASVRPIRVAGGAGQQSAGDGSHHRPALSRRFERGRGWNH